MNRTPWPTQKKRVYAFYRHRCLYCGSTENLTIDHIIPWSRGGGSAYGNFQVLCEPCNFAKGTFSDRLARSYLCDGLVVPELAA